MNEVIEHKQKAVSVVTQTPSALLALAIEKGADIDQLEKLMALQERWEAKEAQQKTENNCISITCVVTHLDGHSEQTTMESPPETSGSKNAIQAIGSAVSYLQRYTLTGALGITTADEDCDGRLPESKVKPLSFGKLKDLEGAITAAGMTIDEFCAHRKVNIKKFDQFPSERFDGAINWLKSLATGE